MGALRDLRTAFRSLARAPLYSGVAILTIGIGIGATTAIFSVFNSLVLRPLPFADGERVVRLRDVVARAGADPRVYNNSTRNVLAVRESGIFADVAGQEYRLLNLTRPGEPARLVGIGVSEGWVRTVGVTPILGRAFTPREEQLGIDSGALLIGHRVWQSRFGGSPEVLDRRLILNGRPFTVVGVMPPRFNHPYGAEVWFPRRFRDDEPGRFVNGVARLRPGQTFAEVARQLDRLAQQLASRYPDTNTGIGLRAIPIRENLLGNQDQVAKALLLGVSILLLLACASVAGLAIVRILSRHREMAIRAAVGAPPWRQVWGVAAEGLVLAAAGGIVGAGLAWAATPLLARLTVAEGASLGAHFRNVVIDHRVLLFAAVASAASGMLAAALPPALLGRADPATLLHGGPRTTSRHGGRATELVVVYQIAFALMLTAGAGLMLEHLHTLSTRDIGYQTQDRFAVELTLSEERYPEAARRVAFVEQSLGAIRALPGVVSAGATHHLPSWGGSHAGPYSVEGGPVSTRERMVLANLRLVTPGYIEAMDIPIVLGRSFNVDDHVERRRVIVVSQSMARRSWGDENPIGRFVRPGTVEDQRDPLRVVGVAGDVEETHDVEDTWYQPYSLAAPQNLYLVVHATGGMKANLSAVRETIRRLDPLLPVDWARSLHELHVATYDHHATGSVLMAGFAGFGLLVAALGLYGVLTATVARRQRELAVRLALGARPGTVTWLALRRGLRLVVAGLGLGLLAAFGMNRLLVRVLSTVRANVPVDFAALQEIGGAEVVVCLGAGAFLAGIAMLASLLPALRAGRIDPAIALRE